MVNLLTIYDLNNYGNRLQNYALSEVLKNYDPTVITIPDCSPQRIRGIKNNIRHGLGLIYYRCVPASWQSIPRRRKTRFESFTRKHIPTHKTASPMLLAFNEDADYVVGSDQVWNPFFQHLSDLDTLAFLNGAQGISYAASFGVDELPQNYALQLAEIAKNFKAISVREESAKQILEPFVNDVQVHVDPTLLLSAKDWVSVMRKPKDAPNEKYVLLYYLGILNDERRSQIEDYASKNCFEIVELMDPSKNYYAYGPAEFLWAIQHAEVVFTDSFHGSVFSFLFDTPFIVYEREDHTHSMASRMDTFLPWFHLEDRSFSGSLSDDLMKHDYSSGYVVLDKERERSFEYLKQNLT